MAPRQSNSYIGHAGETAPGVAMLKQLWDIPTGSQPRERAPQDVTSDIYSIGPKSDIPSRRSRRRR